MCVHVNILVLYKSEYVQGEVVFVQEFTKKDILLKLDIGMLSRRWKCKGVLNYTLCLESHVLALNVSVEFAF